MRFDTPVAFFAFNRPQQTRQTFARIAQLKPKTLLLVADGPRGERDRQRCEEVRAILRRIDWACDVRTNFSDVNLGCRRRVSSGLEWVFSQVQEAIILEDDCLPDPTFFRFCHELLARYRDEPRIAMISGDNFQHGRRRTSFSYYFSMIPHIWGWASWRRAWRFFDVTMQAWPMLRQTNWLRDLLGNEPVADFYHKLFERGYRGEVDTWDIQWVFACFLQGGLTILPRRNLVTNIGFGPNATHTRDADARESNLPVVPMEFPLKHPPRIARQIEADEFTFKHQFGLQLSALSKMAA